MTFQHTVLASALLSSLALASPQWGNPNGGGSGNWGPGGPFTAFPSCASSCQPANIDYSNPSSLCTDSGTLNGLNSCIDSSSCDNDDKNNIRETIAQLCVNAGASITQAPFNTYSVTSGGSAWPTAWTTNSAWASAVSAWSASGGVGGAPGWHGGANGPFGHGWGPGPWSSGAWASGPWTAWWGTDACPDSTWSGWTAGTWSDNAPWTSWTACSATATASRVIEVTTTNAAGSQITSESTSFGYQLADVTNAASSTSSGSGAKPTNNMAMVGSAAGVLGVLAGAVLL